MSETSPHQVGNPLLTAALHYAALGWQVFPLKPGGKKPYLGSHGLNDASNDAAMIRQWWAEHPQSNIGVRVPDGIVVVDIDKPGAIDALEDRGITLPATLTMATPHGRHLWFQTPNGTTLRQTAGELADGVDTRCAGVGYLVMPPSIVGGKRYSLLTKPRDSVTLADMIAPATEALIEALQAPPKRNTTAGYEVDSVIPEGSRNTGLASVAGSMRRRGLGQKAIGAALLETNRAQCRPPLSESEVRTIARSVSRYPPEAKPPTDSKRKKVMTIPLSAVNPQPVTWLWPGVIPMGKLTLDAGRPGLGKSCIATDISARATRGGPWPTNPGHETEPINVLIVSGEDALDDTIRPRLDAAGADVNRVFSVPLIQGEEILSLNGHLDLIAEAIGKHQAGLLVVDPLSCLIGGGVDSHRDVAVRRALGPLAALAETTGCAVLCVHHRRKQGGGDAISAVGGSLAFGAAARAVWMVGVDPADPALRVMAPAKLNLARDGAGAFSYRLESVTELSGWPEGIDVPRVVWSRTRRMDLTANDLLADPQARDPETDEEAAALGDALRAAIEPEVQWEGAVGELAQLAGYRADELGLLLKRFKPVLRPRGVRCHRLGRDPATRRVRVRIELSEPPDDPGSERDSHLTEDPFTLSEAISKPSKSATRGQNERLERPERLFSGQGPLSDIRTV